MVGAVALAVFVVSGTIAGFLFNMRIGFAALSLTSVVAAYLIGAE